MPAPKKGLASVKPTGGLVVAVIRLEVGVEVGHQRQIVRQPGQRAVAHLGGALGGVASL